jgi:DNA-binding response OmpR family regulator
MRDKTILLVEDDQTLGYILSEYLEMKGFQVVWATNGKHGLEQFQKVAVDLCVLDVMMPEMGGFELLERIRLLDSEIPVIFLTARSMKIDKLKGFNLGADDYISKPVDEEELLARIHAILRRSSKKGTMISGDQQVYEFGKFLFDMSKRSLVFGTEQVTVTEKESRLLEILLLHQNQLVKRSDALKQIWGSNDYFNRKSMDVHIHKLRKLLAKDPGIQIKNIHGRGFILSNPGQIE